MTQPAPRTGARLVWRYATGARLDGQPRTGSGRLTRMPRWQHAAWRLGVPAVTTAGLVEYAAHPAAVEAGLLVAAAVGGRRGVSAARTAWRMHRFHATYTKPTLAALRPALGDAPVSLHVDPELGSLMPRLARPMSPFELWVRERYGRHVEPAVRWLPDRVQRAAWAAQRAARPATRHLDHFRRPVTDPGQRIQLDTAVPYLTAEQRQYVSAVIGAKIPAGELVETWDQVGRTVRATWTVRRRPPTHVGYADLDARFADLAESEFFLGLGVSSARVTVDLHDDAPHIALSAGSGAGKSVFAQLIAVQVLARGGRVILLDRKGSHRWALGMPGVDYCTRPEEMHRALIGAAALADRRNAEALHQPEGWDPGHRVLVIAEELNATMAQIRAWWDEVREKGQPKIPPAIRAFRELLFMGRSAKINVLAIAQMLSALATGGPEARENFGVRALARYTKNNWQMLVDGVPMPRPSRTLGRWQIVVQGAATETQVCYLTADQARLFVHKHRGVPASPPERGSPLMAADQEMSPGHGPSGDSTDPRDEQLTLREACDRRLLPWEHAAAKKRLQRARGAGRPTPPTVGQRGQADLYRAGDLLAWAESELIP